MLHKLRKTVSLVLLFAMLSSGASCSKKSTRKDGRKIASDDPWFDAKVYSIETELDSGGMGIDFNMQNLIGVDDKYIVINSKGNFCTSESVENDTRNSTYNLVTVVDRNTFEKVSAIDLNQYLRTEGQIVDVGYSDGKITSMANLWDVNGSTYIQFVTDAQTGEKIDERELLNEDDQQTPHFIFQVGRYTVIVGNLDLKKTTDSSFCVWVISPEGEESYVELKKPGTSLFYIPMVMSLSEDKLLVPVTQTSTNIPAYFEIDIKEEKAVEADGADYEWIDFATIRDGFCGRNGEMYFSTSDGISKVNMQSKKIEEFFNFDACHVNHEILCNTEIVDCSDESIVLLEGMYFKFSFETSSKVGFDIYEITRASSNPHAGKTVLELYAPNGYVERPIADAIIRFNETNEDYFIEVTGRYTINSVWNLQPEDTMDDAESENLRSNLSLDDWLVTDIINGAGPDILILSGDMGRFYNSDYVVDLNKYFGSLDPEKYFTNIIEAAKTDDKLYQLPITYSIKGIHTDSKYAGASGQGFTTSEYEDFLYGPLNGYDLIQSGQAMYFTTLFNAMSDKFIVNGKADFSGPEFAELADFVKKNVSRKPPKVTEEEDDPDERREMNDMTARLVEYPAASWYFEGVINLHGANAILGIPTTDGRGPQIRSQCSLAISAHAVNVEACAEFAKILISDEVQSDLAVTQGFPLSREAFRKIGSQSLDYINGPRGDSFLQGYGGPGGSVKNRITFTEDDVSVLERTILSCSHFDSADASINFILIEEMPPYFYDQKDLEAVIKIAQDRVQKVLDERG